MHEYDIIPYADTTGIPIDRADCAHRLVNVTEMFKASGAPEHKKPAKWFEHESTQELIEEVLKSPERTSNTETRKSEFLKWAESTSITETRRGTTEGGQRGGGSTWYCQELALAYAMYLSPRLHLACLRFILGSQRQPKQVTPAAQIAALEQRVAALEQARHLPEPEVATITITLSLSGRYRLEVMRELGGAVSPKQLFTELKRRGEQVKYLQILTWLHQAARRGVIKRRARGRYELRNDNENGDPHAD